MSNGTFRLLERFRKTFLGTRYDHRNSSLGNIIGRELFEDLMLHSGSAAYVEHVRHGRTVVNRGGKIHTPRAIRRNDSILGRPPAGFTLAPPQSGFSVFEGPVAEPRVGCELKILAKSQLKQIGRVISDLERFADRMRSLNERCINIAVVGVNYESDYVGWEGGRPYRHRLTSREPETVSARLTEALLDLYDELVILRFRVTNQPAYPFGWAKDAERVKALAARTSPKLRDAVVALHKSGHSVDAYQAHARESGEDLVTARAVVELLAEGAP